jgi:hypothetical protein
MHVVLAIGGELGMESASQQSHFPHPPLDPETRESGFAMGIALWLNHPEARAVGGGPATLLGHEKMAFFAGNLPHPNRPVKADGSEYRGKPGIIGYLAKRRQRRRQDYE